MSSEQDKPELGKKFEAAFNEGLRELRKQFPSDNELAKHTGISQPTISKMLLGNQEPRLTAVSKILDKAGAEIVFPWSKRNETRRIAVEGFSGKAEEWKAVNRFVVEDGKVKMLEETGAVLPLGTLKFLSPSLSLGVFGIPRGMQSRFPSLKECDDVLVDFSSKLALGENNLYLAIAPNGKISCAQVGRVFDSTTDADDTRYALIFSYSEGVMAELITLHKPDAGGLLIGKIVYVMGTMRL